MTSVVSSHPYYASTLQAHGSYFKGKFTKMLSLEYSGLCFPSGRALYAKGESLTAFHGKGAYSRLVLSKALINDDLDPADGADENQDGESSQSDTGGVRTTCVLSCCLFNLRICLF